MFALGYKTWLLTYYKRNTTFRSHHIIAHRIASRIEELPEQLKLQGLSDQQLRRPPADPARCPGPTRAVDCGWPRRRRRWQRLRHDADFGPDHFSRLLRDCWQSLYINVSFLGVFTSLKFSLRRHSCFAVIESGEGNLPPPYGGGNQNNWLRDEKKLTLSLIRIPSRRTTTLDEFWIWKSIHTILFFPGVCPGP